MITKTLWNLSNKLVWILEILKSKSIDRWWNVYILPQNIIKLEFYPSSRLSPPPTPPPTLQKKKNTSKVWLKLILCRATFCPENRLPNAHVCLIKLHQYKLRLVRLTRQIILYFTISNTISRIHCQFS